MTRRAVLEMDGEDFTISSLFHHISESNDRQGFRRAGTSGRVMSMVLRLVRLGEVRVVGQAGPSRVNVYRATPSLHPPMGLASKDDGDERTPPP